MRDRMRGRRRRQNHVRIRASKSEGINAGQALAARWREWLQRRRDAQLELFKIDMRTRRLKMQAAPESARA